MHTIRGWEDLAEISEELLVVIWGAGNFGCRLLQEARVNKIKTYIYDCDEYKIQDKDERLTLAQIKQKISEIAIVIAVEADQIVNEISDIILKLSNKIPIYRYVPKDAEYLEQKLENQGFNNGMRKMKAVDVLNSRRIVEEKINSGRAFFLSRWGSLEGEAVYADLSGIFIEGEIGLLKSNAGFFPLDKKSIHKFTECYTYAAKEIDILAAGCWCSKIEELYRLYSPGAILVPSGVLCPIWKEMAWARALKDKKVLVIHPFASLIEKQYLYRKKLFESPDILPEMDLKVYQAVQSMNGSTEYDSWFTALNKMENDIIKIDFEIALIGCGAYGMPLGAFIKSILHKQAIHIGGSLQLIFGIKGKRWDDDAIYNEYWVRPTDELKPQNYKDVEDGCYW